MVTNLRQLRTKRGISQQRLADSLGITQQAINKYENHAVEPDIYMLSKMADYFGTTIDYLVGHAAPSAQSSYTLSTDEATLIEKYRTLTAKERESIQLIADNYMESRI